MREFFRRRHFEARYVHTLRVHAAHDVTDRAVFAGGVQRLDHDEHAVRVLGGEARLVLAQEVDPELEQLFAIGLLDEAGFVARVEVLGEMHGRSGRNPQGLDCLGDALHSHCPSGFVNHGQKGTHPRTTPVQGVASRRTTSSSVVCVKSA